MARFSYRKFAEIQVQGARERAFRQVEVSQLASRLDHVEAKYKELLQAPKEKDMTLYHSAVVKAFSNEKDSREVSLFMTSRFAQICRQEYHTIMADKALIRLHNDHRAVINWLFQQVQEAEKEQGQMVIDLARKVEETRRELREFQQRKLQKLQANLEWKKAELRALRDRKMKEIEDRKEQELIRARELVEKQEWQDRSEWVDIEDDFLMGSEWVVCSE
jgi:aminopeptidase N